MSTPFLSDLDLLHAAERLLEEARHDGLPPVCLAICNADGQPAFFLRMDGAPVRLIAIAQGKVETPYMPHSETLKVMHIMDDLRQSWGVVFPASVH